jgi:ABC-type lipoprotein export system ATPase subunit
MIELKGVCKYYEVGGRQIKAVDGVDLTIGPADFLSIMGHSGSGKSTLLSLMGGLTRPTFGSVLVDGVDLWSITDADLAAVRNRRIGFVFQFASLIPTLTALENVMLPAAFGAARSNPTGKAASLLSAVGLGDKTQAYPGMLSGGEQRRVAIARSFINDPAVVLADEPTGDLDKETEAEVFEFFSQMSRRQVAFVLVTHSSELAEKATIRLKMDQGRLSQH